MLAAAQLWPRQHQQYSVLSDRGSPSCSAVWFNVRHFQQIVPNNWCDTVHTCERRSHTYEVHQLKEDVETPNIRSKEVTGTARTPTNLAGPNAQSGSDQTSNHVAPRHCSAAVPTEHQTCKNDKEMCYQLECGRIVTRRNGILLCATAACRPPRTHVSPDMPRTALQSVLHTCVVGLQRQQLGVSQQYQHTIKCIPWVGRVALDTSCCSYF